MAFSKTFPRKIAENTSPIWEEVFLTEEEEKSVEEECRKINFRFLDQSIEDAKHLAIKNGINTDEIRANLAIALFEKRASHVIFCKEHKAKEKFDKMFKH